MLETALINCRVMDVPQDWDFVLVGLTGWYFVSELDWHVPCFHQPSTILISYWECGGNPHQNTPPCTGTQTLPQYWMGLAYHLTLIIEQTINYDCLHYSSGWSDSYYTSNDIQQCNSDFVTRQYLTNRTATNESLEPAESLLIVIKLNLFLKLFIRQTSALSALRVSMSWAMSSLLWR